MRRGGLVLLVAFVVAILGLVLWELEFQHLSLVAWLLVICAVLWCCAEVAVSLQIPFSTRRKRSPIPRRSRPRIHHWAVTLIGAVVLAVLSILLWLLGFETTSQLVWFLVVIALLWACAQVSFLLRPDWRARIMRSSDSETPISTNWARRRTFLDRLLPGATMRSGFYNRGNEEVWDGNEKLPPHPSY